MGGEVIMIPEKGEAKKIKAVLKRDSYVGPEMNGQPCDFWVTWRGNKLALGYSFGSRLNSEWAYAVGLALCKRFKFKKAGWDSIGYVDKLEEFTKGRPFGCDIRMLEKSGVRSTILRLLGPTHLKNLRRMRDALELAAERLVNGT